jgi:hypothetical protein
VPTLELDWRVRHIAVAAGDYAVAVRNADSGKRSSGTLPFVQATYEWSVGRLSLADRSRLDELSGIAKSPRRYRNRLSMDWSLGASARPTHLIVAQEVFYDWSASQWSIQRTQLGFGRAIGRAVNCQLYAVTQHNGESVPARINALWLILQVRIE